MSSWNKFKLRELCTLEKKLIKPEENIEYIHYSLPAFDNNKVPEIQFGKEIKSSKFKVEKGCILFNKLNLRFKRVWNINYDIKINSICSTEFLPLKPKENILSDFLYYLLIEPNFTESMLVSASGTSNSHQRISPNHLMDYEFLIPDIEKQEEIVNCLSHLDYKIELNIQINQTLEQIAQAIFKSWFIDFDPVKAKAEAKAQGSTDEQANIAAMSVISGKSPDQLNAYKKTNPTDYQQLHQLAQAFPSEFEEIDGVEVPKGWQLGTLGSITKSKRIKVKDINAIVLSAVSSSELIRSNEYFDKQVHSKNIEKYLQVHQWDFAYNPSRINIGSIGLLKENIIGAVSPVYEVFSVKENYHWFMEKIISEKYVKDYISMLATGSVRQSLKLAELQIIPCIVPTENIINIFNEYYETLLEKINFNKDEIKTLESIRDLLLPKLLSGEIYV